MDNLHPSRQSSIFVIFYSLFLISTVVSPYTHQSNLLVKRQTSSVLDNSLLNPFSPNASNPLGSNRAINLNPTTLDPASNSSSTPTLINPNPSNKESPLIPLLGPPLGIPTTLTNSSSPLPTNSTSSPPVASTPFTSTTTLPTNKTSSSPTPAAPVTPVPTPTSASTSNSVSSKPTPNSRAESHASNDHSTFGSTTIKILAISGGVAAALFLLWTVIRKWKFRPSKRFASKLEDYDEHMFEPRPPSFTEKRPNDYPSYPANQVPIRTPSPRPYVPYPSERAHTPHTPHNYPRHSLFSQGPSPYPVHRLSNTSVTKPLPTFDSNYRLSLGLSGDMSHSYPPSDYPQPKSQ